MNFTKGANVNMTGFRGYVEASLGELCEVFGKPDYGPNDHNLDKTTCEWHLKFEDGLVASIYDYKVGYTPIGPYEWHIGGHDKVVVSRIQDLITLNRDQLVKMVRTFKPNEKTTG